MTATQTTPKRVLSEAQKASLAKAHAAVRARAAAKKASRVLTGDTEVDSALSKGLPTTATQAALAKAHATVRARAAAKKAQETSETPGQTLAQVFASEQPSTTEAAAAPVETPPAPKAEKRPALRLVGTDGNAFSVMAKCRRAARNAGWTAERIESLMQEMMGGDYNNLLAVAMKHFDVD